MSDDDPIRQSIDQAEAKLRAAGWTQHEIDLVTTSKEIGRAAPALNPHWTPPGPRNAIVVAIVGRSVTEDESEAACTIHQLLGFLDHVNKDPRH
jgi:hypothetical protein